VVTAIVVGWKRKAMHPEWHPIWMASIIATVYLMSWSVLLSSGVTTREPGEAVIRLVQIVGLVAMGAVALALRGGLLVIRRRPGGLQVTAIILVMLALLEVVWLSLGFHLLSLRLIY
jgi:hypothetical protein